MKKLLLLSATVWTFAIEPFVSVQWLKENFDKFSGIVYENKEKS